MPLQSSRTYFKVCLFKELWAWNKISIELTFSQIFVVLLFVDWHICLCSNCHNCSSGSMSVDKKLKDSIAHLHFDPCSFCWESAVFQVPEPVGVLLCDLGLCLRCRGLLYYPNLLLCGKGLAETTEKYTFVTRVLCRMCKGINMFSYWHNYVSSWICSAMSHLLFCFNTAPGRQRGRSCGYSST